MWHNTRRGHNLIRKRYSTRKFRLNVVNICIITTCLFVTGFAGLGIYKLATGTDRGKAQNNVVETNASTNIEVNKSNAQEVELKGKNELLIYDEPKNEEIENKTFSVAFLGDLMMGGEIGKNLNYNYMSAFKNISEYTTKADYTVLNLSTNIIDLKELKNPKSDYIVTKNIENAFSALGIDGINIASDHMMDFGKSVFQDTIKLLKEEYDLIGLKDSVVYVEQDGIKIAIIGVCNEVIGLETEYTDAGIMMYNMKQLKSMIKEAKKNVNTVVMLTHLGLENTHKVTNVMSWFYRELVDAGADAILGSHALGLYPVEMYNGKPIVYSMGNLMSNTDYLLGKESGIFTLNMDANGKLKSLEILPLYINAKKQTVLYSDYNKESNSKLLKYLTQDLDEKQYITNNNYISISIK